MEEIGIEGIGAGAVSLKAIIHETEVGQILELVR